MLSLRRSIPSLGALATFEAAARLESFTLAASELGVTQAAVSRQIKLLESDLNTPLFLRAHRRVVLTPEGAALAATVTNAFDRMAEMIDTIRQPLTPDTVTIGASLAFSHFWLLPRLAEFRALHPEAKLKLVAEDAVADLRKERLDLAIRYGRPPFDDGRSVADLRDEVFPVCSPALLERRGLQPETVDPFRLPLIVTDSVNPSWLTWRSWARNAGCSSALANADTTRLRFNHHTDSIQAAINGEGVALGWAVLLSRPLIDGQLVRLGRQSVVPEERYHVILPFGREPTPLCHALLSWLTRCFEPGA
ncbi:LysR substrate-binding domain-containing protein [Rhodobacter sp. NSM]|uniref:LysR substrate-binding domain-containing protein n=1 Tax=Rhodobacter sp. NSM TaxID=3457501 RepID=UPI003FD130BC